MRIAAVFLMAGTVVQADPSASGGERPSSDEPQNVVSLLQTNLLMDGFKDGVQEASDDTAKASGSTTTTFSITDDAFGEGHQEVRMKVLRNTVTGERAEVAYNVGGRTEALVLKSPSTGELREVLLHSHRNASEVMANIGWKGDMLIPYANRIKNGTYSLNGRTYNMERNEDRSPYGKEGLHGYLYRKVMKVVEQVSDDESASLTLGYDFDGTDEGYPFLLSVALIYKLDKHGLTITTKARNRGSDGQPLPFFNSWHSYFNVTDVSRTILSFDRRCSQWNHITVSGDSNIEGDLIPTGSTTTFNGFDGKAPIGGTRDNPTYWDDEFKATASVKQCPHLQYRVYDPAVGDASVLWADSQYRWAQIYTGTPGALGEQAIAVEAMSGECDSWNNMQGVRLLQSGEEWEASFGVYLDSATDTLA